MSEKLSTIFANAPLQQRMIARYMGNLPDYGALLGTTHLNPMIAPQVPQGAPRPLMPGEYIQNPGGGWSSEISMTVPHPNAPGAWTNIPSVWLVNGQPMRLTQDEAIRAAYQSRLNWPQYATSQQADQLATAREDEWQRVGRDNAASIPPLWGR